MPGIFQPLEERGRAAALAAHDVLAVLLVLAHTIEDENDDEND